MLSKCQHQEGNCSAFSLCGKGRNLSRDTERLVKAVIAGTGSQQDQVLQLEGRVLPQANSQLPQLIPIVVTLLSIDTFFSEKFSFCASQKNTVPS